MLIGSAQVVGWPLWIHRYPTRKPAPATKIQRGRFSALSSLDSYYHWILISSIVEEDTKSWYVSKSQLMTHRHQVVPHICHAGIAPVGVLSGSKMA